MMGAEYNATLGMVGGVQGVTGDPMTDGFDFSLWGGDGANNVLYPNSLNADGGSVSLTFSDTENAAILMEYDNSKTYLMGFPFESIAQADDRAALMGAILTWFEVYVEDSAPETGEEIPIAFSLEQNYPNPFNPSTEILFSLPEQAYVTLSVFDVTGREVATLVSSALDAGRHNTTWTADEASSGIYFYRIQAVGEGTPFSSTRKMILIK
jgi:predicted RNase H-like HicB family nuclease